MAVVILVTMAFVFLLLPYYGAVLWATIVAILFYPLHEMLCRWFGGRSDVAAAVSIICFVCIVLIPGSIVLGSLADEATRLYGRIGQREFDAVQILQRIRDALPSPIVNALGAFQIGDLEQIQSRIASSLGQAVQTIASRPISIGQGTMELTISFGIMLYLLFFLFRDGPELVTTICKASPLSQRYTDQILLKFASVSGQGDRQGQRDHCVDTGHHRGTDVLADRYRGRFVVGRVHGALVATSDHRCGAGLVPGIHLFADSRSLSDGNYAHGRRRSRDRHGRQHTAAPGGRQGSTPARLSDPDLDGWRDFVVWYERLCAGTTDRHLIRLSLVAGCP
jgi:hypothetical protein